MAKKDATGIEALVPGWSDMTDQQIVDEIHRVMAARRRRVGQALAPTPAAPPPPPARRTRLARRVLGWSTAAGILILFLAYLTY